MKLTSIALLFVLTAVTAAAQRAITPVTTHVDVYKETGRFAGWPANNGIWSWGDEILVGFSLGYFKEHPEGGHAIDRDKPSTSMLARSLDGGETWAIEQPTYEDQDGKEAKPTKLKEGLDFSNPNMCLRFRGNRMYYSPDRGKNWVGPHTIPTFGRHELLARTDYIVNGPDSVTAFVAATKANKNEGQPLCIRTTDGGITWNLVGWIGLEPPDGYGYSIMPSTIKLDNGAYLSAIRRAGVFDGVSKRWIEMFLSPDQGSSWYMLDKPHVENSGNPGSMIKLQDGRIALTYGVRANAIGIRGIISEDEGQTWGPEFVLRADAASWDIGYPRSVQRTDGKILTIYYYHHPDQPERYIACTIWDPGTRATD